MNKHANQYKPCPPIEELEPHIRRFFSMGLADKNIHELLLDEYIDKEKYGLSIKSFKRMRQKLGLKSTRQQAHTVESSKEALDSIRERFPKAGFRDMQMLCRSEAGMRVNRRVITEYFHTYEPEGIENRKARNLKRKQFWCAGVNDIWAIDQHDKWKRFHLWLHTGIEPYSGKVLWTKFWWTNKNPRLILSYYLEFVSNFRAIPLVTQSDSGTENYGVANAHTALRHMFDSSLINTRQHRWMPKHSNIKPEIMWSQIRRRFTPGFESLLDFGLINDLYDPNDILDILTFRWLFIPYLQGELDSWIAVHNTQPKRADRNKLLPGARPDLIFEFPKRYETVDYKVHITPESIDLIRDKFAPPDDPVFTLVPSEFYNIVQPLYTAMGSPMLTRRTIWPIFVSILDQVHRVYQDPNFGYIIPNIFIEDGANTKKTELTNLQELRGYYELDPNQVPYMGGVIEVIEEEERAFAEHNRINVEKGLEFGIAKSVNIPIIDFSDEEEYVE